MRLIPFIIVTLVTFFILCYLLRRRLVDTDLQNQHIQRVPGVQIFLEKIAKKYKKTSEKEACAICLDEFCETKLIAELKCNSKHIFHLDCLTEWVKKNDICPICRQRIE
jgi:hypothetical protein